MLADKYLKSSLKKKIFNNVLLQKMYYHLPYTFQAYISKKIFKPKFSATTVDWGGVKTFYGNVSFGEGTCIGADSCFANITVGNYVLFARGFRTIHFTHDYHAFTCNDSIRMIIPQLKDVHITDTAAIEPNSKSYEQTIVGNDVWFGENVTIMGGVHIGNGAVIAAQSVVTHDVPPYAIVGGVPARILKWRFDNDTIDFLEKIKWWNWSQEKIAANYEKLCKFDRSLLKQDEGSKND